MKAYKIVRKCMGCKQRFSPTNGNRYYCTTCRSD